MFKKSFIVLPLLLASLLAGCIITGRVVDQNGDGIEGVTVTLTGAANLTTTTDSKGCYIFGNGFDFLLGQKPEQLILIAPGSYTVTPSKTGYDFTPSSDSVSVTAECYGPLDADLSWPVGGVDFEAARSWAPSCTYSISPTSRTFSSSSGTGSISVTSANGCTWTASEKVSWITITSGSSGSGNGTVTYSVSANTGSTNRTATITVAGRNHTVTQSGDECVATLRVVNDYPLPQEIYVDSVMLGIVPVNSQRDFCLSAGCHALESCDAGHTNCANRYECMDPGDVYVWTIYSGNSVSIPYSTKNAEEASPKNSVIRKKIQ